MLAHKSRTKSPRNIKNDKSDTDATSNNVHQFQGQKLKGQARLLLRLEVYHLPKGRLRNFKTGTPIERELYQLPRPAINAYEVAYEVGFLHAGGGIPCQPHPAATQFVIIIIIICFLHPR